MWVFWIGNLIGDFMLNNKISFIMIHQLLFIIIIWVLFFAMSNINTNAGD
jgi:uncharacterized membrane protein YcaP (DUF421 family)